VFIGTLYPLALEAVTGAKISVGAPFFEATFLPLTVPLLLVLPFGQTLAWKRGDLLAVAQRLAFALGVAILVTLGTYALTRGGPVGAPLGIGLGAWLILGSATEVVTRSWKRGLPFAAVLRRAAGLPRSAWGTAIAHAGVGITVIGISATAWGVERIASLKAGDRVEASRYEIVLDKVVTRTAPDYKETAAILTVRRGGAVVGTVEPGKRTFTGRAMPTSEAGLLTVDGLGQIYASVADIEADGKVALRLYYKPLVLLIWLGAVVMAFGGGLSLLDRRSRIAAPAKARATLAAGIAPAAE
jgi:cytochrome c-type biogenesis protein CcmF